MGEAGKLKDGFHEKLRFTLEGKPRPLTGLGHEERVLELAGPAAVARGGRPVVGPVQHLVGAFANHGLDCEGVAHRHDALRVVVAVVQNRRVRVENRPHPVPAKLLM